MEKISCHITKDLLPLYVENVLSEETAKVVAAHLETCDRCRRDYEQMADTFTFPAAPQIEEENRKVLRTMKKRLRYRRIRAVVIAVIVTASVFIASMTAYTNVSAVYNFFTENTCVTLREVQTENDWLPLTFEDGSSVLNFDRLICDKEVVVDANSTAGATFRITDIEGNIALDDLYVAPGEAVSLDTLDRNTDYIVEIQATATFLAITFC